MSWPLRFHPEFDFDVMEHGLWLESQSPGMGDEFASAVEQAIVSLHERPESFRILFSPYRRVLIRRFHIVIPFRIFRGGVYVIGVVHGARNIRRWMNERDSTSA